MALNNINLDDKRWVLIAQQARLLIPSFAPEWTDHNVSDPGITFLELCAWLEEIQRYRLNRTSARIRDQFFALAGVQPEPPKPATALVEFKTSGNTAQSYVLVPAKTGLVITARPEVLYRTVRDSYLVAGSVSAVETIARGRELDRTQAEKDGAGHFDAFGSDPAPGDSLVITLDRAVSAPQISLFFRVFDHDLPDVPPGPLPTPSVSLRWEYSTGSGAWQQLTVSRDTTAALTLSGFLALNGPATSSTASSITMVRAVVVSGSYEIPPRLAAIRLNVLEAEQIGLAEPTLDKASGLPDQEQKLPLVPIDDSPSPVIQVGPTGAEEAWTLVSDFADSDPSSKHYTFDRASGIVRFGNGLNGMIPPKDSRISVKPFAYTLGAAGNLNPGMNWRLNGLPQASAWFGANSEPAFGGSDQEDPNDTELRARGEFRNSVRGVTAADFNQLTIQTPGIRVGRAKALPGLNPLIPGIATMDDVTIVVLPAARPDLDFKLPSDGFLATVRRNLEGARLVAGRLHVISPEFLDVDIAATVTLKKRVSQADVNSDVSTSLRAFLSPQTWPFGRDIFPSEIHQHLISVPGIAFASNVRINGQAASQPLRPIDLPRVGNITLQILEARDA